MKKSKVNEKKRHSNASLYRSSITITDIPENLINRSEILAEEI